MSSASENLAERLDRELRTRSQEARHYLLTAFAEAASTIDRLEEPPSIVFLGNPFEGHREIQALTRLANGFVVYLPPLALMVDPGPDIISRSLAAGIQPARLKAIFVSHPHIDHYVGVEAVIEEMCLLMMIRRGYLLLSVDTARSGAISAFHRGAAPRGGPTTMVLEPGKSFELLGTVITPVTAYHPGGGCGLILEKDGLKIGYTSDTNYVVSYRGKDGVHQLSGGDPFQPLDDFEEIQEYRQDLKDRYSKVDVLIANVGGHNSGVRDELSSLGLAHLLRGSQVKLCLLTHFLRTLLVPEDLRDRVARYVEAASGVKTMVACSCLRLDLAPFANAERGD
ncbi:MAG: MBL fold metallo-hydrolase [Chloroflexi bacterium]|nr:MBL fold metallo-hydrolase [Chloroflexota bacterium]